MSLRTVEQGQPRPRDNGWTDRRMDGPRIELRVRNWKRNLDQRADKNFYKESTMRKKRKQARAGNDASCLYLCVYRLGLDLDGQTDEDKVSNEALKKS